jgi:pyruvate/2-oxoglutarate/acetoin dehydrogenase E1 component
VAVEEGPLTGGWAGEVVAIAAEHGLHDIDDVWRIATADHPIPFSPPLEDAFFPGTESIAASVAERLGHAAPQ